MDHLRSIKDVYECLPHALVTSLITYFDESHTGLDLSTSKTCPFCDSSGDRFGNTPDFRRLVGQQVGHRVLRETEHFVVIPSLGQIVEGYLLIMPKAHVRSIALIDDGLKSELEQLYRETSEVLEYAYRRPIFYEHGMGFPDQGNGCCVDHAHIHAVPVTLRVSSFLQSFRSQRIKNVGDLSGIVRGIDYLYVEDASNDRVVYYASKLRSQYMRYLIAEMVGAPDKGDWTIYPGVNELLSTIRKLGFWQERKLVTAQLCSS
jgi:diadenosine tetraphosphate (Ap4A) HIT family hydrolase